MRNDKSEVAQAQADQKFKKSSKSNVVQNASLEASEQHQRRYDFMLQEHGMETFVKTVGVLQSHTNYFATTDVSYFILMKIHNLKINLR